MRHQSTANAPSEHDECADKSRHSRRGKSSLPQTKSDRSAESTQNIIDIFKNSTDIFTNIIDILTNSIDILTLFRARAEFRVRSWQVRWAGRRSLVGGRAVPNVRRGWRQTAEGAENVHTSDSLTAQKVNLFGKLRRAEKSESFPF